MFDYKIDLSTYYPSNENKFNIYVDEMANKVASNVSLPYVISMDIWKSSYTIYLENLSEGCGEIREIVINGYTTTTTTLNFILTTTKYVPPTTLFTTTTTTTTTSTTITTITTQYVPPTTIQQTTQNPTTLPPETTLPPPPPVGNKRWYNNPTSRTLSRNNCPSGCTAGSATYYVEFGKYYVDRIEGVDGQGDVDFLATQDLNDNAQNYVNNNAGCTDCPPTVFWNTQQTISKTRNDCGLCEGTSVNFIVLANTYSSTVDVNDANNIAIAANQENAQINANLNGQCINCPQNLGISTAASGDCAFGVSYVSVGGYNGVPFDGNRYEFWVNNESPIIDIVYGRFGLPNGLHTAYVRDATGTTVSQQFNISCPEETTTTTTSPPCDCYRGVIRNVGEYFYTNCNGNGESGYISNRDDIISICIDVTQSYTNVDNLVKSGECGCS